MQGDVAADMESLLAGPLESVNSRLDTLEANEAADAKQLAEQQQRLWAADRTIALAGRNSHLMAQSLSEVRPAQNSASDYASLSRGRSVFRVKG